MTGVRLTTIHRLDADSYADITRLVEAAAESDGYDALSEHKRLELAQALDRTTDGTDGAGREAEPGGPPDEFAALFAHDPDHPEPVGYAQLNPAGTNGALGLELVMDPRFRGPEAGIADALLGAAVEEAGRMTGNHRPRTLRYWASHVTPPDDRLAAAHGLRQERDLIQLRRPLPIEDPRPKVETRAFVPGQDEEAWLEVNNRAFATHPEQGNWTFATLLEREAEPWFDPAGFRLYEPDGRLAASCWTKVHDDTSPPMGEIYVISVDPDFQGHGLGRALTVAGLDSLAGAGLRVGMLYVDGDNPALSLYQSMGFVEHHIDRAYVRSVGPPESATS
ncbi:MAG TPA: mycothiol synthase [Acidimicrobiales bacterium]|nr:mycothiol synthase [Acidimicrobiales bacterium]